MHFSFTLPVCAFLNIEFIAKHNYPLTLKEEDARNHRFFKLSQQFSLEELFEGDVEQQEEEESEELHGTAFSNRETQDDNEDDEPDLNNDSGINATCFFNIFS